MKNILIVNQVALVVVVVQQIANHVFLAIILVEPVA
jgi:hypothetical protein